MFLAQALLKTFSGKGLVPEQIVSSEHFLLAVALGAGVTIIAATLMGFPVSTTHGLTGAMIGSGLMAAGSQVNFQALGKGFLLPLLLSPVLAVILAASIYFALHSLRLWFGITKEWCVCIGGRQQLVPIPQPQSVMVWRAASPIGLGILTGDQEQCEERYAGQFVGVQSQQVMDASHFVSAGVVSFARGLNDTPKIAAMLLIVKGLDISWGIVAIAVAIAMGGLLNARKVAETMGLKITAMNHGQGLAASLSTGILVILASLHGFPVSTTHVSVGALFGIGLTTGKANPRVVIGIVLSWILTLPFAIFMGALLFWGGGRF